MFECAWWMEEDVEGDVHEDGWECWREFQSEPVDTDAPGFDNWMFAGMFWEDSDTRGMEEYSEIQAMWAKSYVRYAYKMKCFIRENQVHFLDQWAQVGINTGTQF